MKNKVISRILELCDERGISLYKLAKLSDISRTTLNNTVSQNKMPTIPTIEKICNGLDITLAEFFSSENLFPDVTEEQRELIVLWEALLPEDRKLVKKYMGMLEEFRKENDGQ
ncbi:helix-turn-helix transcriptional regulator [Anaerovorax odorimutans]|uniref:Helix-turn-helix transcriptional regulator n=1 Tax=Anaerovorax odorimutans TaxID=109327 RepID=A0ABT1RRL6_9FIRM|nr:helix-turn-helix transcriptional regulator [Anaerovorax odorimutans]MCQ4637801.1 helix-turn-helix transcriptional regulator [Anaerovorax odorimutans]